MWNISRECDSKRNCNMDPWAMLKRNFPPETLGELFICNCITYVVQIHLKPCELQKTPVGFLISVPYDENDWYDRLRKLCSGVKCQHSHKMWCNTLHEYDFCELNVTVNNPQSTKENHKFSSCNQQLVRLLLDTLMKCCQFLSQCFW